MTIHQCPKCELRFSWQTELDDHCRTDHPRFHHDYPVGGIHHDEWSEQLELQPAPPPVGHPVANESEASRTAAILSTYWTER